MQVVVGGLYYYYYAIHFSLTGRTCVDVGVSAYVELVDSFCYLGDMLGVDGGAGVTVEAGVRVGWNKFRQ